MTDEDYRAVADKAAREAEQRIFETLGIDISTEDGRREFRETLSWARRMRELCNNSTRAFVWILITMIVSSAALTVWEGIKTLLNR